MIKKLGVVVPMATEAGFIFGWRRWRRLDNVKIKTIPTHSGFKCLCVRSGIGPENAAIAASRLIDRGATALIATGVAGGLEPGLLTGDLVVSEFIIQAEGREEGNLPAIGESIADPLSSFLMSEGFSVHPGHLLTTSKPILTASEKSAFFRKTGAKAVDMESASVLRAAQDLNLPFLAIRSICDSATADIPVALHQSLNPEGTLCGRKLLAALVCDPFIISRIVSMGVDFLRALIILRNTWHVLLKHHRFMLIPEEDPACGGMRSYIRT